MKMDDDNLLYIFLDMACLVLIQRGDNDNDEDDDNEEEDDNDNDNDTDKRHVGC